MDPSGDPIREYIRANKDRFTRKAITDQLIAAGHDPARVDAIGDEEWHTGSASVALSGGTSAPYGLSFLAWVLYIVCALLGAFGAFLVVGFSGMSGPSRLDEPLFVLFYAVAYLGLGFLIVQIVQWGAPRFEIRGIGAALLGFVLVSVYGGVMFGTCIAAANVATGGN